MADSGPGQPPEQVSSGVRAEQAAFPHAFTPQCPTSFLSAHPQGGLHRRPLICPAGPPMAQTLIPAPRLRPWARGPGVPHCPMLEQGSVPW